MAIETFKPVNQTISEIFSCDGIYKIPNYQRQYSWTNDQLDALWNDLYEAYKNKTEGNDCYFLGSIVVVNNGNGYYELIDGQQRITTLMILMNVLVKDFPNVNRDNDEILIADQKVIMDCILFKGKRNRLQLQTDPKYDSIFNDLIINCDSFAEIDQPSKKELKIDDPQYKYINSAVFFYNKLSKLDEKELDEFVNYIFYATNIIKIECTNQSFAIKLFQVLNDRGLDLSPADIVKSYIIGKYEEDDETGKQIFNNNWKNVEDLSKQYGFKIDDFIVFYEYYKLKANPKKQVVDELRDIIEKADVYELVEELYGFANALKKVYESKDKYILSLRYIPWRAYVMTALTSAYYSDYEDKENLFKEIRRFFYISLIAGCTLNQIKQTSFKLIESIVNGNRIDDIRDDLNKTIISRRMIAKVYEALENDVYNEKFLKPLMLSLEYEDRESINNNFYELDSRLHMDHILPKAYKQNDEWKHINAEEVSEEINGLGNMALLLDIKNEEALNCGWKNKVRIYKGLDENGKNKSGITTFELTRKVLENENIGWNIQQILERKQFLMNKIEAMLEFNKEDINKKLSEDYLDGRSGKSKWLYKGVYYDNAKLIRALIHDYIIQKDITQFEDIPEEIRNYKMFSHELIIQADNEFTQIYSYARIIANGMELYIRSICLKEDTCKFLEFLKEYFEFDVEKINATYGFNRYLVPNGIYYISDYNLQASMRVENGKFIVLKGSQCLPCDKEWIPEDRKNAKIENGILMEDVECDSPSTAAWVVWGYAKNGWLTWKTENGECIDIYRNQ